MRRQVLYSASRRALGAGSSTTRPLAAGGAPQGAAATAPATPRPRVGRLRAFAARRAGLLRFIGGAACAALIGAAYLWGWQPPRQSLTQEDIDAAVLHTITTKPLPSRAAKAAEMVRPSLVRVRGFGEPPPQKEESKAKPKFRAGKPAPADSSMANDLVYVPHIPTDAAEAEAMLRTLTIMLDATMPVPDPDNFDPRSAIKHYAGYTDEELSLGRPGVLIR